MATYTVAFAGLPSSGKSSLINSLLGVRTLKSGICRTTTEVNIITDEIKDDDNNIFNVIDLPGICDSEEKDDSFNKLTYEYITKANLICWCSDVRNAFLTSHEVLEFNKLKEYLNKKSYENNKLYELDIILTKCSEIFNNYNSSNNSVITISEEALDDEIKEEIENTSMCDIYKKIKEKFSEHNIILFNAFGRSYHHKKSSITLRNFVEKIAGIPSKENINFSIASYVLNYKYKNIQLIETIFLKKMDAYILDNSIKFEDFINLFERCKNKEIILTTLCNKIKEDICNRKKEKQIFTYLYKNSKFICNQKLFLYTYYDILFDIIRCKKYSLASTLDEIYDEMNDSNYFYEEENFIKILNINTSSSQLYYPTCYNDYLNSHIPELLNKKYTFSEHNDFECDKNYIFIKHMLFGGTKQDISITYIIHSWLYLKIDDTFKYSVLNITGNGIKYNTLPFVNIEFKSEKYLSEYLHNYSDRDTITNLFYAFIEKNKLNRFLLLSKLNDIINNKYNILYNKTFAIMLILSNSGRNIPIRHIYESIIQLNYNRSISHEFGKILGKDLFLSRLIELTEYKNIFRNCLKSIYEFHNGEIEDILNITQYTIDEII